MHHKLHQLGKFAFNRHSDPKDIPCLQVVDKIELFTETGSKKIFRKKTLDKENEAITKHRC